MNYDAVGSNTGLVDNWNGVCTPRMRRRGRRSPRGELCCTRKVEACQQNGYNCDETPIKKQVSIMQEVKSIETYPATPKRTSSCSRALAAWNCLSDSLHRVLVSAGVGGMSIMSINDW